MAAGSPFDVPAGLARPGRVRRVLLLGLGAVLVAIGAYAGYVWHGNQEMWRHLRTDASRFVPPAGWTFVGRAEQGSGGCFISCDTPRVTLVYRVSESPVKACALLRRRVDLEVARTRIDPSSGGRPWCPWYAPLASTMGGRVSAGADAAGHLRTLPMISWAERVKPAGDGTLAWIEFASGLR